MTEITYTVPDISCGHCKQAVSSELSQIAAVDAVEVDIDTKVVTVHGHDLDDAAMRAALAEAGYEAAQETK
jgi:copper chaperone